MRLIKKMITGTLVALVVFASAMTTTVYANDVLRVEVTQTSVVRLGGSNRIETANLIADEGWKSADTVFLANSGSYADALAGTPLAYAYNAPILLTDGEKLSDSVKSEIKKLGAKNIYILGGEAAISDAVLNDLKETYIVTRIWGQNRFDTAVKIAEALESKGQAPADIFIASGVNYPDALSASSAAAIKHAPILYAPANGRLDEGTIAYIHKTKPINSYILGGKSAVGEDAEATIKAVGGQNVTRLGGSDRYETSVKISKQFDPQYKSDIVCFATGKNFPDALAGSVLAAKKSAPVLLTDNEAVHKDVKEYISSRTRSEVYVFGGTSVVSDEIINGYINSGNAEIKAGASVENGDLVIRIADPSNGLTWAADEMAKNNSVLKYKGSEVKDGFFTARYSVAGDGKMAVRVRHFFSNTICDELHSWDVTVKNGKIANISEETVKKSPEESVQDTVISGDWKEYPANFTEMTIAKNEDKGWNVEITSPVSRGAYIFKATVYYDCELEAFAYNKGKFFDIPLDGTGYLGEAVIMGATGYIKLSGTGRDTKLAWHNDAQEDSDNIDITFTRVDPNDIDVSIYDGDYVWDRCSVNVSATSNKNELVFEVKWSSGVNTTTFWNMSGILDPKTKKVVYTNSKKVTHNYDSSGKDNPTVDYENGTGNFEFDEKILLWNEDKDDSAKDKIFYLVGSNDYTDKKDEAVKNAVKQYLRSSNLNTIEEISFNIVTVLSEDEIAAIPGTEEYNLSKNDLVFTISYDIKVVDGVDTINYAIPDGEVDGQWVRNISRVGVVRYVDDKYSLDPKYFGTGF